MRSISKQGSGGYHLSVANATPPATRAEATSRWKSFSHKSEVSDSLLTEQYQLCCYSELRPDQVGLGHHIEHVEPKSSNPARTFDYLNLAVCALDSTNDLLAFKAQRHEVFGGHAKLSAFDPALFIAPHKADCARYFAYLSDGRVVPQTALTTPERVQAQYTIDLLNLNSTYLITRRQQWWNELDELFQEHIAKDWNLLDLIAIDLVPTNNTLSPFFTLTRQFFGSASEQTLQHYAPALL